MTTTLPRPLRGIVPPLITPLLDRNTLDLSGAERLVDHVIRAGVNGIFALGTTGESPSLSHALRSEFVTHLCSVVNGRVPVLVNVTDTAMEETVDLARRAADAGAAGLVVSPPYYFLLSQGELLGYLRRLVPELPLPVYLYNYPDLTKNCFAPETVITAARELPKIYGIKDSSGDLKYLAALVQAFSTRPEFAILCGPEELLSRAIALGAHGGVTGGANLWPELHVELYRAAASGDAARLTELDRVILDLSARLYNLTPESSSYLRGLKCALSVLGYCHNVLAEPYEAYGPDYIEKIRSTLAENGFPGAGELRSPEMTQMGNGR